MVSLENTNYVYEIYLSVFYLQEKSGVYVSGGQGTSKTMPGRKMGQRSKVPGHERTKKPQAQLGKICMKDSW